MRGVQERGLVAPLTRARLVVTAGVTAVAVIAVDQLTKSWALERLKDGPVHLFGPVDLDLAFNSGAAFSLGPGLTPILTAVGVGLVVVLISMTRSVATLPTAIGLGMLIGGACGNLADRLFRDHDGAVIDFVDVGWWPVFNAADVALVCGAIAVVLFEALRPESRTA